MSERFSELIRKNTEDFIKLTDRQQIELARLYIEAAGEIKEKAQYIINKEGLTYAQAKIRISSLLKEAARLSNNFEKLLDKSLIEASDLSVEANKAIMKGYEKSLSNAGQKIKIVRLLDKVSSNTVKAAYKKIYTDGLKLSDRLWLTDRRTKQEIERIVMKHILSGSSASDKATLSALDNLLKPSYKKAKLTSLHGRRVGYESSRLLRTVTAEAFNEGTRISNSINPGVSDETWLTAAGCCEICDEKDGKSVKDVGYPTEHPNCRCTTLAVVESIEGFTDRWLQFMDNPSSQPDLANWYKNIYPFIGKVSGEGFYMG